MDPILQAALQSLISALAVAVAAFVGYLLKGLAAAGLAYLKTKLSATQLSFVKEFASTMVRALKQSPTYQEFTNADKLGLAIVQITQFANEHGIMLGEAEVRNIIEEQVQIMKSQLYPDFARILEG